MANQETVIIRVAEGELRGQRKKSRAACAYWSFQGVPYAKPPLGPLRFKDAEPPEPWDGVRDALAEGDNCRQFDGDHNMYVGSEDCLYLNVYATRKPSPEATALPVMLFIHGGGFEFGSGDAAMFGPDYLVADGVVLVTINYRVGVLGFLFLEEASPGNVGLKDQVAALRWVQRNIAAFGGDPGNVTLFGMSAGGASVHMHMLSPMSKGLFHRAIAMSGAALNPWAIQTEPEETSRRLARLLGCTSDNPEEIVEFLRDVDHEELVRVAHEEAVPQKDRRRLVTFSFVPPAAEGDAKGDAEGAARFLPRPAELLMREGAHHAVPFVAGLADCEAMLALAFRDFRKEDIAKDVDARWEETVLPETRLPPNAPKSNLALHELRRFFMGGQPLSDDTMQGFMDMISDLTFHEGIAYALRCMAQKPKAPLYQYLFTVDDKLNFLKPLKQLDKPGACHADDIGYLFRQSFNDPELSESDTASLARKRMVRLWTNFAKTGNPTPEDDPLLEVRWKPFSRDERNFLEIGAALRPGTDLFGARVAFWEEFYATFAPS